MWLRRVDGGSSQDLRGGTAFADDQSVRHLHNFRNVFSFGFSDPDIRETKNGTSVVNFILAAKTSWKN